MRRGLVLGKFMPLHKGHLALIEFALIRCDELIVLICAAETEPIPGALRLQWMETIYGLSSKMKIQLIIYSEVDLPNTSQSSRQVSNVWANYLKPLILPVDVIFASEMYAQYMAEVWGTRYEFFDLKRTGISVSATQIRTNPFKYWDFIPEIVRPYYLKKVCLCGTESSGKTTLTKKLAAYYDTNYVAEVGRDVVEHTDKCTPDDLIKIAKLHAKSIIETSNLSNKILFVDTDVNITKSYSKFLFNADLNVPDWVMEANRFDLYLYLDNDAPFIQDGTRLDKEGRDRLNDSHKRQLVNNGVKFNVIRGDWQARFENAIHIVNKLF